mmetsp:Transcript_2526/g.6492  ORF Transcript_2526/g.6492 Transcript_2526/m.6492 type:complete len:174 (-) Transcript_2526:201-722(-)
MQAAFSLQTASACTPLSGLRRTHRRSSVGAPNTRRLAVPCAAAASDGPTVVTVLHPDGIQLEARITAPLKGDIYQAVMKKPLGLTLAEQGGRVVVETTVHAGSADKAGVKPGDILHAVTARIKCGPEGSKATTEDLILFQTAGESFKTVAAAVRSNTCAQCRVIMVLERGQVC